MYLRYINFGVVGALIIVCSNVYHKKNNSDLANASCSGKGTSSTMP